MEKKYPLLPPIAIDAVFPVPSEVFVVQLNPVAMSKHLQTPGLAEQLGGLKCGKYLAVMCAYLETPSAEKPWILCEIFITRGLEPSEDEVNAAKANGSPASVPSGADLDRKIDPKDRDDLLPEHEKSVLVMQSLFCRIRCPPCTLPRFNPQILDEHKVFMPLWHNSLEWNSEPSNRRERPCDVECKNLLLRSSPRPVFQRFTKDDEQQEALAGQWTEDTQALYLLPHFDVSYKLDQQTHIIGTNWEEEHKLVMKILMFANPTIPENAYIPIRVSNELSEAAVSGRRWYIEHPEFADRNLAVWGGFIASFGGEKEAFERIRLSNREGIRRLYHPRQKTLMGRMRREQQEPWGLQRTEYLEVWEELHGVEKPTHAIQAFAPSDSVKAVDEAMTQIKVPPPPSLLYSFGTSLFGSVCGLLSRRAKEPIIDDKPYVPFTKSWTGLRVPGAPTLEIRRRNYRD